MNCELVESPIAGDDEHSEYYCPLCRITSKGPALAAVGRSVMLRTCPARAPSAAEIEDSRQRRERELGDIAAEILERSGVTASYKMALAWARRIPVSEVVCQGCRSRQEWLNNKSRQFKRWWRACTGGVT